MTNDGEGTLMTDTTKERILDPAMICTVAGIPYNEWHLKKKDATIAEQRDLITRLTEERDGLKTKVTDLTAAGWSMREEIKALTTQRDACHGALDGVVRQINKPGGNPICPCCFTKVWNREPHKPGCELVRARAVLSNTGNGGGE